MKHLHPEPDCAFPPQTLGESVSPAEADHDAQSVALEHARAEFRAEWQAKQARVERLRRYARVAGRLQGPLIRLTFVVVLFFGAALVLGLLRGTDIREFVRSAGNQVFWTSYLFSSAISSLAELTKVLLNRSADRLEAAAVHYPASRSE